MKKIVLFGLCATMCVSNANAGWFSNLFKKTAEPTTLAEACNTDEITAVCPDTVLGERPVFLSDHPCICGRGLRSLRRRGQADAPEGDRPCKAWYRPRYASGTF